MRGADRRAVAFDFDGVLVETEEVWGEVRRDFTIAHVGSWDPRAKSQMQGLSTAEWSSFMADRLGIPLDPEQIAAGVIAELARRFAAAPPFMPGAIETVQRLATEGRRLAVASSSPRSLLDSLLAAGGVADCFAAVVSSEEVARGKPSPDVYLEAARMLGVRPAECIAVEDSTNGMLAAAAAGMEVWAVPNRHDPPSRAAMRTTRRSAGSVAELFSS